MAAVGGWGQDRPDRTSGIECAVVGQIGKCIELAGGLTVVAEIVGPERLRRLGQSLRQVLPVGEAAGLWRHSLGPLGRENRTQGSDLAVVVVAALLDLPVTLWIVSPYVLPR